MIDYLAAIRRNSDRFRNVVAAVEPAAEVPSCPGWTVGDLISHLAGVQHFWAEVVANRPDEPSGDELPAMVGTEAVEAFVEASQRLVVALAEASPVDRCWSWTDDGTVGWVLRRQAHEALVHRVDAELAAGSDHVIDPDLAADGVAEMLELFLDASDLPDWAEWRSNGVRVGMQLSDSATSWTVQLGRFRGTSPSTGTEYDDPAVRLEPGGEPDTTVRGLAADIDLWLWGRADVSSLEIEGSHQHVEWVRQAAAAGTQ